MSTKEKKMLVPKLRFPEFREAREWHLYVLEELETLGWVELGRGEVISGKDIQAIPGNYPIYSSSVKNNGLMGTYGRFMFDEELISWSVDGGGNFFHRPQHKFSVTNVSGYMRVDTSRINYLFFANQLQTLHASLTFDYQFKAHPSVIRKLYRPAIPASSEQKKIANCLSSLDELIAAQVYKVDALKTHKKGLMQQLFPREGETQPRLRFPEFRDAEEWIATMLGSIASFSSGGTPSKDNPEYWNGTIPWVSASSMYDLLISKADHYVTPLAIGNGTRIAKKGALLILVRGSMLFKRVPICIAAIDVAFNQDVKALNIAPEVDNTFLIYQLLTNEDRIPINETGIGAGKIELADLKELDLFIPSKLEQCRIGECLSNFDTFITAATKELETLKTHKKALMQQLFPSIEKIAH